MNSETSEPAGAQTLVKGLSVLEAVAAGQRNLKSISGAVQLPRSSTHRLLTALVRCEYLTQSTEASYSLGPRLIALGFQAHGELDLVSIAKPILKELGRSTQETVHLGVLSGDQVFYIDKIPGIGTIQMASRIGGSLPAQSTGLGKALISALPENEWDRFFHPERIATPYSLRDLVSFCDDLEAIRQRGYSLDLEESEAGLCCVACVVKDAGGLPVAAVSVSRATSRNRRKDLEKLAPLVVETSARISLALGWGSAAEIIKKK